MSHVQIHLFIDYYTAWTYVLNKHRLKLKNKSEVVAVLTNFVMHLFSFQAGLNMLTVYTARDLKADEILCISIHPGWVRTNMGGDKVNLDSAVATILSPFFSLFL